ncbi:alpha/beta hydrolase fold protein [Ephemerocybe angulata]|uniref:Alpha/beta hydrolase fold protein n=1 Tax=Ephemerocybe angulata TaxID=980116 RepID=A0A8H6M415_9AGAR|nr:alpha/beta hydrolase fold protein [Tulosesus angulatus]
MVQQYAKPPTWRQTFSLTFRLLTLPAFVMLDLVKHLVSGRKGPGLLKYSGLSAMRYLNKAPYEGLKWLAGTTSANYAAWAKARGIPPIVDGPLIDDASIYWLGPKRTDKVVLCVPGGGFWAGVNGTALSFWNYVRVELDKQGVHAGYAVLGYGLYPEASFPTQLRQLAVAFDHLMASGVEPSNIHLVGDSAGSNLILQFLSHLLHPIDGIGPVQTINGPLGGVYLMSPWLLFESQSKSFLDPTSKDVFDAAETLAWGKQYASQVPDSRKPYVEAAAAGPNWFSGLGLIVKHVLISAGSEERFLDDAVSFGDTLRNNGGANVQLEIQEGAVHNEAFLSFITTDTPSDVGTLTPVIVQWVKEQLME